MSVTANQRRLLLELLADLRPHWHRDRNLPARLQSWLAARRAGSRDRRLYRELTYTALRILPWIESASEDEAVGLIAAEAADTPATRDFRAAYAQPDLVATADRAALLPVWLAAEAPALLADSAHGDTLRSRAPLWIRQQTGAPDRFLAECTARGWSARRAEVLRTAWQLPADAPVTDTAAYRAGDIEVQDLGSQLILAATAPDAGGQWFDACAGAGGKTLQLAQLLGPGGHVTAHDIRADALKELRIRADRAGLRNVTVTRSAPASGGFDGVLVDAPCSGSGTWRRAPHLKWTTTPGDLARAAAIQGELLNRFAGLVRAGGRLVYATCSICRTENQAVVETFLREHPEFAEVAPAAAFGLTPGSPGTAILPATHDTDGFYFATLRRAG